MLVTLFVLWSLRPIFRSKLRRRKALSILLISTSLMIGDGGLLPVQGQDRFGKRTADVPSASEAEDQNLDASEETSLFGNNQKLREGTAIPPTIGRVVNLGRRWAFIPLGEQLHAQREYPTRARTPDAPPASPANRLGSSESRITLNRGVNLGWESDPTSQRKWTGDTLVRQTDGDAPDTFNARSQHIILCENQMLQRIVEATRADASDDRWEISGEMLEFFDQNRLLIRTIQRANSN